MFVIVYTAPGKPTRYFHPKGMRKTVRTAWAFPETARAQVEAKGMRTRSIRTSEVAEMMYPNGVQRNQIRW